MSRSTNHELSSWKAVLAQLRRVETTWRGVILSATDHQTYTKAILCNAMVLNDLSNRYEGCGSKRDHVMWALSCVHIDVEALAAFLSDAILLLRSSKTDEVGVTSYADFKHRLTIKHPFAGNLLGPISKALDLHFADPTPASFYPAYQFLSFMTHLTLCDLDLDAELVVEFIENEERITAMRLPNHLVEQMNWVMRSWLRDFKIESNDFIPSHGPGKVAELASDSSLYSKYRLLQPDPILRYVFRKYASLDVDACVPLVTVGETSRCAHIEIVPKSMKTKRVISKEPATLMYFQQGVDRCIRKYIAGHKYLSSRIDLNSQSKQRDAALKASRTKAFATVDLSSASDCVSYELVKRVFHGTALYPYLVALRSRTVELPSGKVMATAKYAPMGSALCFPVESLIFACIVECTIRYARYEGYSVTDAFRVYGDDIIVPDHCLYDLEIFLRQCGFRINESKTYGGSHRFRESCGCDAYDGTVVTCMKIGRRFTSRQVTQRSPGTFAALIEMANTAFDYEYPLLRKFLVDELVNGTGYLPLFSRDRHVALYSPAPDNFRAPVRVHKGYQCKQIRVAGVSTVQSQQGFLKWDSESNKYIEYVSHLQADEIRYFEWLRVTRNRDGDPLEPEFCPEVCVGNAGTYLHKRWISLYGTSMESGQISAAPLW